MLRQTEFLVTIYGGTDILNRLLNVIDYYVLRL